MMKVKDVRGFIFEVYTDQIFQMIDIEEFVKNEIESKGIIVIDEIDKLVKSVIYTFNILIIMASRVMVQVLQKLAMKEFSTICCLCLTELLSQSHLVL